jgi:hypothetical protein
LTGMGVKVRCAGFFVKALEEHMEARAVGLT